MEPIGAVWSSPKAQTTPTLACNAADQSRKLSLAEWGLAIILQRNGFSLRDVADGSFSSPASLKYGNSRSKADLADVRRNLLRCGEGLERTSGLL